ncbi:MAG: serine/threonine protein kinase [Candidatus Eisenbacteria bacterium]|nr:serine/threonine protein kinase [Candidatus Eisenbacteria bacterium]
MRSIDLKGRLIAGRYEVEEWIGEGGFASVWRARQLNPDGKVAIKILHPEHSQDPHLVSSFLREARHYVPFRDEPNVATILECGHDEENGVHFLVMTLLGDTVGSLLERQGVLEPARVLQLAEDVGRALETVHSAGLVHRDVKCSNIMTALGRDRFVLTDFGIGLLQEVAEKTITTRELDRVGSWAYAAPEQIRARTREDIRPSADFYSLGVVLYRAATGQYPFPPHFPQVIQHHLETPPPDPRKLRPDLPAPLAEFLLRALAKDPARRFANGAEWLRALQRVRADLAPARPIGPRAGLWPAAIGVGLALLLLLGGLGIWRAFFAGEKVLIVSTPTARARISESRNGAPVLIAEGTTPLAFRQHQGRAYEIDLEQNGCFGQRILLAPSEPIQKTRAFTLEAAHSLAISSTPDGARVTLTELSGAKRELPDSYTPCQLSGLHAGPHEMVLQLQGRRKLVEQIEVGPGLSEIHRNLDLVGGVDLEIYTTPSGARVRVDGGLVNETTPCRVTELPPGPHQVYLERLGYVSIDTLITLRAARDAQAVRVVLRPSGRGEDPSPRPRPEPVDRSFEVSLSLKPMTFAYIHVDGNPEAINESGRTGPWRVRLTPGAHTFRIIDVKRPVPIDVEVRYLLEADRPPRSLVLDWEQRNVVAP